MNANAAKKITIEIAGTDLAFGQFELETETPTGGKIAKVAGFAESQRPFIIQWMKDGDFEGLRTHEEADLSKGTMFIVAEADASNRITINGTELDWPADTVSGQVIRKLGRIPADKLIYMEREDVPDRLVEDQDSIKIKSGGVEEFVSRAPKTWELNVQGKKLISLAPTITVVDALTRAGFDPNAWIIILRVAGQPKQQLTVNDTIDLRTPGIEKVRLTAKDVNNGEARPASRRDFALLDVDEAYLDELGLPWETAVTRGERWLIIREYTVPPGYTVSSAAVAILVPPTYPQAEIDMFYVYPPLQKAAGGMIPATEHLQSINGLPYQRWSRHRGTGSPWNPQKDSILSHLALVESAIAKEVGE